MTVIIDRNKKRTWDQVRAEMERNLRRELGDKLYEWLEERLKEDKP